MMLIFAARRLCIGAGDHGETTDSRCAGVVHGEVGEQAGGYERHVR